MLFCAASRDALVVAVVIVLVPVFVVVFGLDQAHPVSPFRINSACFPFNLTNHQVAAKLGGETIEAMDAVLQAEDDAPDSFKSSFLH